MPAVSHPGGTDRARTQYALSLPSSLPGPYLSFQKPTCAQGPVGAGLPQPLRPAFLTGPVCVQSGPTPSDLLPARLLRWGCVCPHNVLPQKEGLDRMMPRKCVLLKPERGRTPGSFAAGRTSDGDIRR